MKEIDERALAQMMLQYGKEWALIEFINLDLTNDSSSKTRERAIILLEYSVIGGVHFSVRTTGRSNTQTKFEEASRELRNLWHLGDSKTRITQAELTDYHSQLQKYVQSTMREGNISRKHDQTINERVALCKMRFDFRSGELVPASVDFILDGKRRSHSDSEFNLMIQTAPTLASLLFGYGGRLIQCLCCMKYHLPKRKGESNKFCSKECRSKYHNNKEETKEKKRELAKRKRAEGKYL